MAAKNDGRKGMGDALPGRGQGRPSRRPHTPRPVAVDKAAGKAAAATSAAKPAAKAVTSGAGKAAGAASKTARAAKPPSATAQAAQAMLTSGGGARERARAGAKAATAIAASKAAGAAAAAATGGNVAVGKGVDIAVKTVVSDPKRAAKWVAVALATAMILNIGVPLLLGLATAGLASTVASARGQYDNATAAAHGCVEVVAPAPESMTGNYTDEQRDVATQIVDATLAAGLDGYAAIIATAVSIQDTGLSVLAGHDNLYGPYGHNPDDGWGTPEQLQDVATATTGFLGTSTHTDHPGLVDVPGWETMPLASAAQAVQLSTSTNAYGAWEVDAQVLVASVTGDQTVRTCAPFASVDFGADWSYPLPAGSWDFKSGFDPARIHPIYGYARPHNGIDLAAPSGTPIFAVAGGTVVLKPNNGGGGNTVVVTMADGNQMKYLHLSRFATTTGATIQPGDLLGYVGSTGDSTGPHLHFEIHVGGKAYDPLPILRDHGIYVN